MWVLAMGLFHIIGFSCLVRLWRSEFSSLLWLFNFGELSHRQDLADIWYTALPQHGLMSTLLFGSKAIIWTKSAHKVNTVTWPCTETFALMSFFDKKKNQLNLYFTQHNGNMLFHEYCLCGIKSVFVKSISSEDKMMISLLFCEGTSK